MPSIPRNIACFSLLASSVAFAQHIIPNAPYKSVSDSPIRGASTSYFHLEDFEDGVLNSPGATISGGQCTFDPIYGDSVDLDDGVLDGLGRGRSWYAGRYLDNGSRTIRIAFDANNLNGVLPTHVGLVFTDIGWSEDSYGYGRASLRAFDAHGDLLSGEMEPIAVGDGMFTGQTEEDRFFGFTHLGGISAFEFEMNSDDFEIDHLQYGAAPVPEPASIVALGAASLLAAARRRRTH